MSLYVDHTGEPQVDHTGEPLRKGKYSRVPWEVGTDLRLSARDIRVYFVLAASVWQGNVAKVGRRWISKEIGLSPRLVIAAIKKLIECGHVKTQDRKHGQRGIYELTSSVFAQKQGRIDEVATNPESGAKRLVAMRRAG